MPPPAIEDTRILVLHERWMGSTGLAAFEAFRRMGALVAGVAEEDFAPKWRSRPLRAVRRLMTPALVSELNRALLSEAERFAPHFFLVVKGTFLLPDTLRALRRLGVKLYNFYPDISVSAYGDRIRDSVLEYDWIFSSKSFMPG